MSIVIKMGDASASSKYSMPRRGTRSTSTTTATTSDIITIKEERRDKCRESFTIPEDTTIPSKKDGQYNALPPPLEDTEKHQKFIAGSSSRKQYFDDIFPMGETEVRDALLSEVKRHRYWKGSVIKKMQFDQLEMQTCLHYKLESFTESRSTSEQTESASSSQFLSQDYGSGYSQNPWDYEVMPTNIFREECRTLEMPGSSYLGKCPSCNSVGTTHCFQCRGCGTDKCNFCRGTGMKSGVAHPAIYTHPMVNSFPHADLGRGYPSSSTAMTQNGKNSYGVGTPMHFMSKTGIPPPGVGTHDLCYMCHGRGVKECHHCKGGGKKPCSACNASGNVRTYTRLKVYFKVERSEHTTECEIPMKLLKSADGKEIFSDEQPYVMPITAHPHAEINEISKKFCSQHLHKCMGLCRVIQQRHTLISIPVCKVNYTLGTTKGIFYVYGNKRQCYVPTFPSKCAIL